MSELDRLQGLQPKIDLNSPASTVDFSGLAASPVEIPAIFVVGCPRSGTTLVGNVIGANSECAVGDESIFMLDLFNLFRRHVLGKNRLGSPNLGTFTTAQKALQYSSQFIGSFYADLVESKPGATYAVDHTPIYPHIFEFIELMFPEASYVHVIRDEQATVDSLKQVWEQGGSWGQETDDSRKLFRNHWVNSARSIGEKIGDRFVEVAYEDIRTDPQHALAPVLTSAKLEWEPSMGEAMLTRYAQ